MLPISTRQRSGRRWPAVPIGSARSIPDKSSCSNVTRITGAATFATRRGMFNFDRVDIDYYRDANALFEVFKAGLCDFRIETDPARWLTAYHFPGLNDGRDIKAVIPLRLPKGMDGFAFNTRRAIFADARVREALGDMFDFGWVNRNLYGGLYRRTPSFFAESPLASTGQAASPAETALLAPYPRRSAGRHPGRYLASARRRCLGGATATVRNVPWRFWPQPATT